MVSLNIYKKQRNEVEKFHCLNQIWPWRSRSIATQNNRDLNQAIFHLWSKFGDPSLYGQWVMVRTSSKLGEFWLLSLIWPWRSWSIAPQNNRDLNQGLLHLWSKFGDPSLNGSQVIAQTSKWLTHTQTDRQTHTHTDAGNDNTRRPKLASGKNGIIWTVWNFIGMPVVFNCYYMWKFTLAD